MNLNKIDRLNSEIDKLRSELDNSDKVIKELTRIVGAAKKQITQLKARPIKDSQKMDTAKRNLEISNKDYASASKKYYVIFEQMRQKNVELTQEENVQRNLKK